MPRPVTLILALAVTVMAARPSLGAQDDPVPLMEGLGSHQLLITTDIPETQAYFDQGLRLFYAFNFDESIRSFQEAARLDPSCAMCQWGIAIALGPNINAPMDPRRGQQAYQAIQRARSLAVHASPREAQYVEALSERYGADPFAPREPLDAAYAEAMGRLADQYPDDADAAVIHAAAVMNLSPWDYWTADRTPKEGTRQVLARLTQVITEQREHAGACHFYIHLVESAWPERAVPCAERLPALMPGAGHIVHMPAHVYIRVGRYDDAIERNQHAVHADEAYIADRHPSGEYPLAYYPHNYHFLAFAAGMAGEADIALEAARKVVEQTDHAMLQDADLGGTLQHFITTPVSMLVRFGRWSDVLEEPAFDDALTYPRAHWHFARGMAFVAQDRLEAAADELRLLQALIDAPATTAVTIFGLNTGPQVLAVAESVLAGRLAARRGDLSAAISHLSRGIELESALTYNEPPDWHLSTRQMLGQMFLEAGRLEDAAAAFLDDLETYPGNRWSKDGLAETHRRLSK